MSVENTEVDPNKKRSRKKRKNFLLNAKKYAKKGQMGRGTKIPDELYHYFVGILESMKKGIEDEDERQALVNNVLDRTKEIELDIIGNQLGCRVIELLLPDSSPEDLERFINIISEDLRKLCSDNFTSHVVEALLRVTCSRATDHLQTGDVETQSDTEDEVPKKKIKLETKSNSKFSKEHIKTCHDFTVKVCKYALNNLEDFVWDSYANHILRSVLKCLSGIDLLPGEKPKKNLFKEPVPDKKGIPPTKTKLSYKAVPEEFHEIARDFANRLSSWPQFKDLPFESLTSGLLQVLLYAVKNIDKNITKNILKKLLDESFAPEDWVADGGDEKKDEKEDKIDLDASNVERAEGNTQAFNLPPVFKSEPSVRLLEAALFVAKKKTYTQIYARCFINRLAQLSTLPMLNYTVQRLIDNCQVKEEFEPMFDELSEQFPAILSCGNTGVLVAVAKACGRIKAKQLQFIQDASQERQARFRTGGGPPAPPVEQETEWLRSVMPVSMDGLPSVVDDDFLPTDSEEKLESALKSTDSPLFAVACLRLIPVDKIEPKSLDKEYFINVHGAVILQSLLDYQRPARAVTSLLDLTPEQLVIIFCDGKGSHVADALCKGQCVGVKARDKLIWKLKGYYQKLALSQYGSRAFEAVFEIANPEQKLKIMSELSDKSNLLNSTKFGRVIASKLDVAMFKSSQKQWEQSMLSKSSK